MTEETDSAENAGDATGDAGDVTGDAGDATGDADATDDPALDAVRAAIAEVRREWRKAALVHAGLDAVCVLLAVNLAAAVADLPALDADVAAASFAAVGLPAPDAGTVVAAVAGLVAFGAGYAVRARRPAAERFEAANPEVREALRTARDAAAADRSNPMASALYADVVERLRETSSLGLLNATRLAVAVALAFALSVATVQTAVVGVEVGLAGTTPVGDGSGVASGAGRGVADRSAFPNDSTDLQDGDDVLGDPTNVSAGSENLSAAVDASPGGEGGRDRDYGDGGAGTDGNVDARRAGFASPERVEDAALVQRYARELDANATDDRRPPGGPPERPGHANHGDHDP